MTAEARIAAGLGRHRDGIALFARLAVVVMLAAFLGYAAWLMRTVNGADSEVASIQIEFSAFWAAAKLAAAGQPLAAFDPQALHQAQALPPGTPGTGMLWLYPPSWQIVLLPLGLLPFSAAYLLFSAASLAGFSTAIRRLAMPLPGGLALVLSGPAVIVILMLGNISLLWTAGLVGALAALGRGRAALAGLLIALLTVKPQLGVLIPVALIAGGHWRALIWACVGAILILSVSTVAMGLAYWAQFFAALRFVSELMQTELVRFDRMMTWFALARFAGVDHALALSLQLAATAGCALAVAWVWRRPVTLDLKAATLCIAAPLATPYAYHYEMPLVLAAAMFLVRDGFGATRGERMLLLALWLGPVPTLAFLNQLYPVLYAAPLLTVALGLCLWRARYPAAPRAPSVAA